MAQVTGAIAKSVYKAEVSLDGSTWTDVSGAAATVSISGGDVLVGQQHTADGSEAIVTTSNKVDPRDVTIRAVYTETDSEPWDVVWTRYQGADKTIYVRWSPAGGASGDKRYACAVGGSAAAVPITACMMPDHDSGSGDPALFEFTVRTPGILEETVA